MANAESSSNNSESGPERQPVNFPETRWSLVGAASAGSGERVEAAVRELCERYREPIRRRLAAIGYGQDADDIANGFVVFLLEKNRFQNFVRGTSKFRSFLLTCLDGYRRDEWRKRNAAKRGGGQEIVPFEEIEVGSQSDLDGTLDRDFALAVHGRVLAEMAAKNSKSLDRFEALKPYLLTSDGSMSYAELGGRIGLNANAVKQAVLRMRSDYLARFRVEVADATAPAEVDAEMRYLLSLLVGIAGGPATESQT